MSELHLNDANLASIAHDLWWHHWSIATHEDETISNGDSPVYKASKAAILGVFALAWPDLDAQHVYETLNDGWCSPRDAAARLRRERDTEQAMALLGY